MKDARMNLLMSQQLFDKISEEAEAYEMKPPVYARALLSKLLLGVRRIDGYSPDWIMFDRDNAFYLQDRELSSDISKECKRLRGMTAEVKDEAQRVRMKQFIDKLQIVLSDDIVRRDSLSEFYDFFLFETAQTVDSKLRMDIFSMLVTFFFGKRTQGNG